MRNTLDAMRKAEKSAVIVPDLQGGGQVVLGRDVVQAIQSGGSRSLTWIAANVSRRRNWESAETLAHFAGRLTAYSVELGDPSVELPPIYRPDASRVIGEPPLQVIRMDVSNRVGTLQTRHGWIFHGLRLRLHWCVCSSKNVDCITDISGKQSGDPCSRGDGTLTCY